MDMTNVEKIVELLGTAGPVMTQAAIDAAWWSAASGLVLGNLFLINAFCFIALALRFSRAITGKEENKDDDDTRGIASCCAWVAGGVSLIISAVFLIDIPSWVGVINPEVYLARHLLGL